WYSYLGPREADVQLRVHDAATLWRGGASFPTTLHLGPGGRRWRAELAAGRVPQQLASDGRRLAVPPDAWAEEGQQVGGRRWLWLEIGPDRQATLHEPALVELELGPAGPEGPGQIGVVNRAPAAVVLPLVAEPAPATSVEHGTLVKGSGEDLFYVEQGTLRWVPSVEVLERRSIPWRLRVLEDNALWRLPVGMPLS
ncbi:MAG TPA: hypothetical protein VHN78_17235, partial [Chloroflexota bacterium]|nr:hypothetical protein [Chloroflexota bacterium]